MMLLIVTGALLCSCYNGVSSVGGNITSNVSIRLSK